MMSLNPLTAIKNMFSSAKTEQGMVPTEQSATTATETIQAAEPVSGTFVPGDITIDVADSTSHIRHIRRVVDSFDEDRLHWQEKIVVGLLKVLAYIFPIVGAYFAGL